MEDESKEVVEVNQENVLWMHDRVRTIQVKVKEGGGTR